MRRVLLPIARITFALLGITLALVLAAHALRILPDGQTEALANRKRTVEALTVQLTSRHPALTISTTTAAVLDSVSRAQPGDSLRGVARREREHRPESGSHEGVLGKRLPDGRSTPEFVQRSDLFRRRRDRRA